MNKPQNLMDGLLSELDRCSEVLKLYEDIPTGAFGAFLIRASIDNAKNAMKENDVVKMLAAYQNLKTIE